MSLDGNLSDREDDDVLHRYITEIANKFNFKDISYHIDFAHHKKNHAVDGVTRVTITEMNKEDNVSVIVKTVEDRDSHEIFGLFHAREVLAYEELFPKYTEIQSEIHENDRVNLPHCILANAEVGNEILVLEDLKAKDFEMESNVKCDLASLDVLTLTVKELAKFHALSFIFEDRYPDQHSKLKIKFKDMIYDKPRHEIITNHLIESIKRTVDVIKDKEAKDKVQRIANTFQERLQVLVQPGEFSVFCHGGCTVHNALFRHDEEGKPTKLCFLDFQAMRYANPLTDIHHLIYINTDRELRTKHLEVIKTLYYDSLKSYLELFNIDATNVYPKEVFDKHWSQYLPFGFISALLTLEMVTVTPEHDAILKGSFVDHGDLSIVPGEINLFIHRINDLVEEFVENGFIDTMV